MELKRSEPGCMWFSLGTLHLRLMKHSVRDGWVVWASEDGRGLGFKMAMFDLTDWFSEELDVPAEIDRSWKSMIGFYVDEESPEFVAQEVANFVAERDIRADDQAPKIEPNAWYGPLPS